MVKLHYMRAWIVDVTFEPQGEGLPAKVKSIQRKEGTDRALHMGNCTERYMKTVQANPNAPNVQLEELIRKQHDEADLPYCFVCAKPIEGEPYNPIEAS